MSSEMRSWGGPGSRSQCLFNVTEVIRRAVEAAALGHPDV